MKIIFVFPSSFFFLASQRRKTFFSTLGRESSMHLRFISPIVTFLSLTMVGSALGAPLIPTINNPQSYKDFRYGLEEVRADIESVQCGGWSDTASARVDGVKVSGNVPIPDVSADVPGRTNADPLAHPTTGLGERGDFAFPDSAFGYLSACHTDTSRFHDIDLEKMSIDIVFDDVDIDQNPNIRIVAGTGEIDINPYGWCTSKNNFNKATPRWCEKLFNTWRRMAEMAPRPRSQEYCHCPFADGDPNGWCQDVPEGPPKRYCFDYDGAAPFSEDERLGVIDSADYTKECNGQECRTTEETFFHNALLRCDWVPQFNAEGDYDGHAPVVTGGGYDGGGTSSFYRHYALTVKAPGFEWKLRAECYEYYKEVDPKDTVTSDEEERCEVVILTNDEQNPENPAWKPSPPHSQDEKYKADASVTDEPRRDERLVPDPWAPDNLTNLTLINMQKLREDAGSPVDPIDVTSILGNILVTRQRGSKSAPANARTDAVDDTTERTFVEFWEAQQRELLKMVADPQTRLIMPARFLVGLSNDDPFFQEVTRTVTRSDGTVELTLKAGAEEVGNVLKSLERIFVAPVREVRIPIIVPLASTSEIDTRIFEWHQWKELVKLRSKDLQYRAGVTPDPAAVTLLLAEAAALEVTLPLVDPLLAKLNAYKARTEEVRILRGALPKHLEKLYESQEDIRGYFASWYKENADLLTEAKERALEKRELQRIWKLLQQSLLQTDACQLLWCSNQRYSVPVYSLLDEWWGDSQAGEERNLEYFPPFDLRSLGYEQPDDQLFDFSDMNFPRDPWLIPVLWPVHASVRLPQPGLVGSTPPSADDFPDLPELPGDGVFNSFPAPTVDLDESPIVSIPAGTNLEEAKNILRDIRLLVDGTSVERQIVEEQELTNGGDIDPKEDFPLDRNSMRGAYCRFPLSFTEVPDSMQRVGNPKKIVHVENDLKERIARAFSRWMPGRSEDFAGRVARRTEDFPDYPPPCHEDVVCYFLPPERQSVTTWQWFMSDETGGDFTGLANELRDLTLPDNEEDNPYAGAPVHVLQRLFPLLDLPIETVLHPPSK